MDPQQQAAAQPQAAAAQPQASVDDLMGRMREPFEKLCRDVTQAVNEAAPGRVLTDSEEKVRDLLARFRQQTYQAAVQLRLEAAQAASPPSGPPTGRQTPAEQGA